MIIFNNILFMLVFKIKNNSLYRRRDAKSRHISTFFNAHPLEW